MRKFYKKRSKKLGAPPGVLIPIGDKKDFDTIISTLSYDKMNFKENDIKEPDRESISLDKSIVNWIIVNGVHQNHIIDHIGNEFNIHPLVLENIMNTDQRPKLEDYEEYIFIVLKMIHYKDEEIYAEHISLILGSGFLISFQENEHDLFNPIKERIKADKGRIRKMGCDYLAYTIIDYIIDNYFNIIEKLQEKIEVLENEITNGSPHQIIQTLQNLRHTLLYLRKSAWPLREVIGNLQKEDSPLITDSINLYLRNIYDHVIQIVDMIETFRELISGFHDIYLSNVSNKMNEIMKILTIIATIFIPLSFLAGLYGMNFKNMPELNWAWGYPLLLLGMLVIGILMVFYFRKKNWL